MTTPTVICFDLGGVVVRIARNWKEGCAAAGIDVRDEHTFTQPHLRTARRQLTAAYQNGELTCVDYFAKIAQNTAGLYTADEVQRVHNAWILEPYPGVDTLIQQLNAAGLTTACLSNTNHAHWTTALNGDGHADPPLPAMAHMKTRLASHILGTSKPDQRIYQLAEHHLNAAGPEIVFFDDLPDNIEAAQSQGWNAHLIDHTTDTARQMRHILHNLGVIDDAQPTADTTGSPTT